MIQGLEIQFDKGEMSQLIIAWHQNSYLYPFYSLVLLCQIVGQERGKIWKNKPLKKGLRHQTFLRFLDVREKMVMVVRNEAVKGRRWIKIFYQKEKRNLVIMFSL